MAVKMRYLPLNADSIAEDFELPARPAGPDLKDFGYVGDSFDLIRDRHADCGSGEGFGGCCWGRQYCVSVSARDVCRAEPHSRHPQASRLTPEMQARRARLQIALWVMRVLPYQKTQASPAA